MVQSEGNDEGAEGIEARLAAVEAKCDAVRTLAEAANHLTTVLDPRTLETIAELQSLRSEMDRAVGSLRVEIQGVHSSLEELRTYVGDVRRMATVVWDQAAVSRRLARLEDLLIGNYAGESGANRATGDQD